MGCRGNCRRRWVYRGSRCCWRDRSARSRHDGAGWRPEPCAWSRTTATSASCASPSQGALLFRWPGARSPWTPTCATAVVCAPPAAIALRLSTYRLTRRRDMVAQLAASTETTGIRDVEAPKPRPTPYDIYFVGVGGQGVLTIGEIIAEAAFRQDIPVNFYP